MTLPGVQYDGLGFFFDRCISVHVARIVAHFDRKNTIVAQDDDARFSQASTDVQLITAVAADRPMPAWVSADLQQRRNPVERAALRESGMTIFFFKSWLHTVSELEQTIRVLARWPAIVTAAARAKVPTVFEIPFGPILNPKIVTLGPTATYFKV